MQPPLKFLLVDSLEDSRTALAVLLRRDGLELLVARSGAEALELLRAHDVALAFLDVDLPDMDGFRLAELIRGMVRTRGMPLIFLATELQPRHRFFPGHDTAPVDFLCRPLEPLVLQGKVEVFFRLCRAEQQLAQQQREQGLNQAFLSMMSHDLRDPLHAMILSATLLQRSSKEPSVLSLVEMLLAGGKRMNRMIEELLDVGRARQAGGIALNRELTDLGALLRRVVGETQAANPQHGLQLEEMGDLRGEWDEGRLAQVASSLVGNAVQHGDSAEPIRVRVDGTMADSVLLEVRNRGSIAAETLSEIFNPFRGGRHAGKEGLGVGLFIVHEIVIAHEGSICVEPEPPAGIRCRVELPRHGAPLTAGMLRPSSPVR